MDIDSLFRGGGWASLLVPLGQDHFQILLTLGLADAFSTCLNTICFFLTFLRYSSLALLHFCRYRLSLWMKLSHHSLCLAVSLLHFFTLSSKALTFSIFVVSGCTTAGVPSGSWASRQSPGPSGSHDSSLAHCLYFITTSPFTLVNLCVFGYMWCLIEFKQGSIQLLMPNVMSIMCVSASGLCAFLALTWSSGEELMIVKENSNNGRNWSSSKQEN